MDEWICPECSSANSDEEDCCIVCGAKRPVVFEETNQTFSIEVVPEEVV